MRRCTSRRGLPELSTRRQVITSALLTTFAVMPSTVPPALAASDSGITSRAVLSIVIGDAAPKTLTVGLYGSAAHESVRLFEGLCSGTLGKDLTYAGSSVSRIERGKLILGGSLAGGSTKMVEREIDRTGMVRSKTVNRADAFVNADQNDLSHDRAGLVSMRRGGGAFEFGVTPAANPELDADRIVIGEVLGAESFELIRLLDALPTREPSAPSELSGFASLIGLRLGLGLSIGGIVDYVLGLGAPVGIALGIWAAWAVGSDPRAQPDLAWRPLTKVRIVSAKMLTA